MSKPYRDKYGTKEPRKAREYYIGCHAPPELLVPDPRDIPAEMDRDLSYGMQIECLDGYGQIGGHCLRCEFAEVEVEDVTPTPPAGGEGE